MPDKSVLTVATVVVVACIVSWIPAIAQKDASSPKDTPPPAVGPLPPAPAPGKVVTPPVDAGWTFLGADPLAIAVDPKVDDDTLTGLSVRNASSANASLPMPKLLEFGFTDVAGQPVTLGDALSVEGLRREPMAPGDTAHLLLRWKKGAQVRPGVYDGKLVITDNKKEVIRQVQVTIPDNSGTITPSLAKFNIRLYRKFPFFGGYVSPNDAFTPSIPLQAPADPARAGLKRRPRLGVLSRDLVGTVPLSWDGKEQTIKDANEPKLGLKVGLIPFAGKYEGTLNLSSAVAVTLTATDFFLYPLIVLVIAVRIAIVFQNFLGGGRQILQWKADLFAARDAIKQARAEFAKQAPALSRSYSIQPDVDTQVKTILDDIAVLQGNFSGTLDATNPAFIFINSEIPALKTTATLWVSFGKQLRDLGNVCAEVPDFHLPDGIENPPAVAAQADKLLKGRDVLIADLAGLQTQVTAQTAFLADWIGLANRLDRDRDRINSFVTADPAALKTLGDLKKAVVDAFSILWSVTGQDATKNAAAEDTITSLHQSLAEFLNANPAQAPQAGAVAKLALDQIPAESAVIAAARRPVKSTWQWNDTRDFFEKEIAKRDRTLGILAYILALFTGMNTLYYGHAFGTVSDYIALILWAFASKITVDVLSGGLERFVGVSN